MKRDDRYYIKFVEYTRPFLDNATPENRRGLELKFAHTLRVVSATESLCAAEKFPAEIAHLAVLSAWFHDWSRFEQFSCCHSFADARSFDHGDMSAEMIESLNLADDINSDARRDVVAAVRYHNKFAVPTDLTERGAWLCRIVRDTDKLDILRLFSEYVRNPNAPEITLDLADTSRYSPEIARNLRDRRAVEHRFLRTAADFLGSRFLWAEEFNFSWTAAELLRCKYYEKIATALPKIELTETLLAATQKILSDLIHRKLEKNA